MKPEVKVIFRVFTCKVTNKEQQLFNEISCLKRSDKDSDNMYSWEVSTDYEPVDDVNDQLSKVINILSPYINSLELAVNQANAESCFDIVIKIQGEDTPALYFEREFIILLNKLNAEIDVDLYVDEK